MRVLGIDYGARRIGLAVSDPDGVLALPAGHLERKNLRADLDALTDWVRERQIEHIVIGLPLHMDGRKGPEAEAALAFAEALQDATSLTVDTVDERWTSQQAARDLDSLQPTRSRKRRRQARGQLDEAAAALILRTWLESRQR